MIPDHICFIDLETLPGDATVGMDLTQAPGWETPELEVAEVKPKKEPPKYATDNVKPRKEPTSYAGAKLAEWRKNEAGRLATAKDGLALWLTTEVARFAAATEAAHVAAHDAIDDARAKALSEWRKGPLSPYRGRIACIGVAFGEHPPEVIDCAEDEEAGLRELAGMVAVIQRTDRYVGWVAHNGGGFDFPFIQLRALRHGSTKLAALFHQEKPWDGKLTDTMDWWPTVGGWGKRYDGKKLDDICAHLGIERPDNPISGAEVLDAYVRGDWADVVAHARADVRDLREVYRVLREVRGV